MHKRSPPLLVAAGVLVIVLVAIYAAVADYTRAYDACGGENKFCLAGGKPIPLAGRVYTRAGAPARHATVVFYLESLPTGLLRLTADAQGRFCLKWPRETRGVQLGVIARVAGGPIDPRYAAIARATHGPVVVAPTMWFANGAGVPAGTTAGWRSHTDRTPACVARNPPWLAFQDLTSSSRYLLVLWLAAAALIAAIAGGLTWRRRRRPGTGLIALGVVLASGSLLAYLVAWSII